MSATAPFKPASTSRQGIRHVDKPIVVNVLGTARESIMRHILATTAEDHMECGGWLIGPIHDHTPNSLTISAATGLGPGDARDYKAVDMAELYGIEQAEAERLEVVGRWHTHPYSDARTLSVTDLNSGSAMLEGRSKLVDLLVTPGLSESWRLANATAFAYERVHKGPVTYHAATIHGWHGDAAERQAARNAHAAGVKRHRIP